MIRQGKIDGLPVVDATETLKLHITPRDIKSASLKRPGNCAVAKACKRELNVLEARVHLSRVYLRFDDQQWLRYFTPLDLRSEIVAFDRGGRFAEGEYSISRPSEPSVHPRGPGGHSKKKRKKKIGLTITPRKHRHVTDVRNSPF